MKSALLSLAATGILLVGCGKESADVRRVPPPPLSVSKIKLVGITTLSGTKRALLRVESSGNSPGQDQSLFLGEGQTSGQVGVLAIDEKSASARVRLSGVETVLTLAKNDSTEADTIRR